MKVMFDVSVAWKRPFLPVTVVVMLVLIACVPLSLVYGLPFQILAPVLLFGWFATVLILSARTRKRDSSNLHGEGTDAAGCRSRPG
jgi:hypothetical protein